MNDAEIKLLRDHVMEDRDPLAAACAVMAAMTAIIEHCSDSRFAVTALKTFADDISARVDMAEKRDQLAK